MTEKIQMKSIRIYGSESAYAHDETIVFSWYDAGAYIRKIAEFAPRSGGYDKTKFEVTFEDGVKYGGRLDIQHYTLPYPDNDNDLAQHIFNHIRFYTGQYCPSHMTQEHYEGILAAYPEEQRQQYQDFLDTYDIPETDGLVPITRLAYCLECKLPFAPNGSNHLCGRCASQAEEKERARAEVEQARLAKESDPLYPTLKEGRTAVTRKMRQLLRERSGKAWSVRGGRGTGWGWLDISAPPARLVDGYKMTPEDQEELRALLGEGHVHHQGVLVSPDSWWHYLKACRGDFSKEVENE